MLNEYMLEFEKRNPNMKVFNAVMHLDEATPHLHINFIPICHSPNRGLPIRVSLKGALKEQGLTAQSLRNSEWQVWANTEKKFLAKILKAHGFGHQIKNVKHSHMSVDEYKEYAQEIQKLNEHINAIKKKPVGELTKDEMSKIKNQNDFLRSEIEKRDEKIRILSRRIGAKFVPFDVYSQEKIQNSVLVSMARLKPNTLKSLAESGMKIYSCVDNDEAGHKFEIENGLPSCRKVLVDNGVKDYNELLQKLTKIGANKTRNRTKKRGEILFGFVG